METKCIKDVDEETWKDFKSLAIKNNMKMSILLKIMVNEFEKNLIEFRQSLIRSEVIWIFYQVNILPSPPFLKNVSTPTERFTGGIFCCQQLRGRIFTPGMFR